MQEGFLKIARFNKYTTEKHPALKLYLSLGLTFFILIIFGPINVLPNDLSHLSGSEAEIDTIENFDDGVIQLQSYSNQDVNPTMWSLENTITYNNSPHSLKLYGNTWKLEVISPMTVDTGDVWQVSNYIKQVAEIQGFGITDSINTLLYSFAGTEEVNPEEWITVYQGAFPNNEWNEYQLPIADDWLAKFGYLPIVKGIIFINDRDYTSQGISYFDEIIDITNSLPDAPQVEISYTLGKLYKNSHGITSVDVEFTSNVYDPDSGEHNYFWDFGDDSTSTEPNPSHTFLVEDDHDYTVLLDVVDQTELHGRASCQIHVDPGPTTFPITMNFVGDVMLARRIDNYINLHGYEPIFDPTLSILGEAADITVANLECALTNQGTPHPTKSVVFRGSPENVAALTYAGIDAVTIANNHILDYGLAGLQQTKSVLEGEEILLFGAGADSYEAMQPAFYLKSGVNFALLGSSDRTGQYNNEQPYLDAGFNKPGFANLTESNVIQQINSVRNIADLIICEMHSGSEYSIIPVDLSGKIVLNEDRDADEDYSADLRAPLESDIEMRHFGVVSRAEVPVGDAVLPRRRAGGRRVAAGLRRVAAGSRSSRPFGPAWVPHVSGTAAGRQRGAGPVVHVRFGDGAFQHHPAARAVSRFKRRAAGGQAVPHLPGGRRVFRAHRAAVRPARRPRGTPAGLCRADRRGERGDAHSDELGTIAGVAGARAGGPVLHVRQRPVHPRPGHHVAGRAGEPARVLHEPEQLHARLHLRRHLEPRRLGGDPVARRPPGEF